MMAPTIGELAPSGLRVGCVALTRKPDLGNANVGIDSRIALLWSGIRICLSWRIRVSLERSYFFMLGTCLDQVRKTVPLVHNITNY